MAVTLVVNGTETLVATVLPEDTDTTVVDRTVTWKSSDESVATVNSAGKVTAVASGTTTVTVTATNGTEDTTDDKTATCAVTVTTETEHEHSWGEPTYEWANDNGSVTATLTCKRDASHVETETAKTTSAVTKEPTEAEEGVKTYTATFTNPAFETQTKTEPIPKLKPDEGVSYRSAEGDGLQWTKGSSATADFTFKRSVDDNVTFSHFTGIQVDGKDVDAANYTAEPGSVIVKLKPAYLETLAVGKHTLTAMLDDADNVDASFEVLAAPATKATATKATATSAKTGDATPVALLATLAALNAALLAVLVTTRIRRSAHAGKRTRR